jgi:hypothetical protein
VKKKAPGVGRRLHALVPISERHRLQRRDQPDPGNIQPVQLPVVRDEEIHAEPCRAGELDGGTIPDFLGM